MNVLVFAPHPDDELLGCGGTIAKHINNGDSVFACIVTTGCEPLFNQESVDKTRNETKKAHAFLGIKETIYLNYPAANIESCPRYELNKSIRQVVMSVKPTIIYMPHYGDMQKDHELVADAIMVSIRPRGDISVKKVYSYETLSETEWNYPYVHKAFVPQHFVDISSFLETKINALSFYKSQLVASPAARSLQNVECLAKLRGSTIAVQAAEAFMVIREIE